MVSMFFLTAAGPADIFPQTRTLWTYSLIFRSLPHAGIFHFLPHAGILRPLTHAGIFHPLPHAGIAISFFMEYTSITVLFSLSGSFIRSFSGNFKTEFFRAFAQSFSGSFSGPEYTVSIPVERLSGLTDRVPGISNAGSARVPEKDVFKRLFYYLSKIYIKIRKVRKVHEV